MQPNDSGYELLLEAPTAVDAALAQELLESRGIPSVMHGVDRYSVAYGASAQELFRPDLLVPKGRREEARAILDEAWGSGKPDET